MNACQICLENNSLVTLDCSHQLCRSCLQSWTINCPFCRSSQSISLEVNNIQMNGVSPIQLNISINSEKGKSLPITENEVNILKNIFGNFHLSDLENIDIYDKILIQSFSNNSWWIGLIDYKFEDVIKLKDTIFLKRTDGSMFYTMPKIREYKLDCQDTIFKL